MESSIELFDLLEEIGIPLSENLSPTVGEGLAEDYLSDDKEFESPSSTVDNSVQFNVSTEQLFEESFVRRENEERDLLNLIKENKIAQKVFGIIAFSERGKVVKHLLSTLEEDCEVAKLLCCLEAKSLIKDNGKYHEISQFIQRLFQEKLQPSKEDILRDHIVPILNTYTKEVLSTLQIDKMRDVFPTILVVEKLIIEFNLLASPPVQKFFVNIPQYYHYLNLHKEGVTATEEIVKIFERQFSNSNEENSKISVIRMKFNHAIALKTNHFFEEAKTLLQDLYDVTKDHDGAEKFEIAAELAPILMPLRTSTICRGDFSKARELYEQSIGKATEESFPKQNIKLQMGLADLEKCVGNFEKSAEIYSKLLPLSVKVLGPLEETTLTVKYLYALCLSVSDDHQTALGYMEEMSRILRKVLGVDHIKTIITFMDYSEVLLKMKKFTEAKTILLEVKPAAEKQGQTFRLKYMLLVELLNEALVALGERGINDALKDEQDFLSEKLSQMKLEKNHGSVIYTQEKIGKLWYQKGELQKALVVMKEVTEKKAETWTTEHKFYKDTNDDTQKIMDLLENLRIQENVEILKCPICFHELKNDRTLRQHQRKYHKVVYKTPIKLFRCLRVCKIYETEMTKSRFKEHLTRKRHIEKYGKCEELLRLCDADDD